MNSIENQLVDSSKTLIDLVVQNVGNNQLLLDETMELLFGDRYPVSMRAGRVAQFVCERHPHLAVKHLERIISFLPEAKVDGAKRSALKILINSSQNITENHTGELIDIAFMFAESDSESISVRAYALDIIAKTCYVYPELKSELRVFLESIYPNVSKGLKSRCKNILKQLERI